MKQKNDSGQIRLNTALSDRYDTDSNYVPSQAEVNAAAKGSDIVIVVISRYSEEAVDRSASSGDYYLSSAEINLPNQIQSANFKHVIIVFNVGGVIDTSFIQNYSCIDGLAAGTGRRLCGCRYSLR